MSANQSDLLSQINSIIQKSFFKEKHLDFDSSSLQKSLENAAEPSNKIFFPFFKKTDLKKIEERIEKLEDQNDQLLGIIHFLVQKFSELMNGLLDSSKEKEELNCPICEPDPNRDSENHIDLAKNKPLLTKREMDVFGLLSKGLCAKEIAKTLFISEATVITHKRNLKEKFHAKNSVELISNVLNKKSC